MRWLTVLGALFSVTLSSRAIAYEDIAWVIVTARGPASQRVRVAEGNVYPCGSEDNRQRWVGQLAPDTQIEMQTAAHCMCIEHTRGAFTETDWEQGFQACRPVICDVSHRHCRPSPDPTIRVTVSSQ